MPYLMLHPQQLVQSINATAKALRDKGVLVLAVGIAGANPVELLAMAGSSDKSQDTRCVDCSVVGLGPDVWVVGMLSPEPAEPA